MPGVRDKYFCPVCGTEMLCTKPSKCEPECCGKKMEINRPKELPAAD